MSLLGVVAALPAEARALGTARRQGGGSALATLHDGSLLALSGMGLPAAAAAAETLLAAGCSALLNFGLAGGLDPALQAGALLVPRAVCTPDGTRFATDAAWRARMVARAEAFGAVAQGELLSCAEPLAGIAAKAQAHARTGAVAVDMESTAVAGVAARHGVPFLTLRAVVDGAQDALPRAVAEASRGGGLKVGVLLAGLARRPGEIGALFRLSGRYRVALKALARLAHAGPLGP